MALLDRMLIGGTRCPEGELVSVGCLFICLTGRCGVREAAWTWRRQSSWLTLIFALIERVFAGIRV